ncbi:rhomboid family intramembrane serine protease [Pseudoflavitalea sp. G-6-1-2]|uniref:rhomboid family intramembrane serine protease n=1 Tax=Pseudoflavitalea sp. G-6-1-2 TaxID=2728841 RepID=UPI00146EDC9A|nr:rhomboid family intramembrane serine protease [Pseudoflavitalea sp. G-6-1-2]
MLRENRYKKKTLLGQEGNSLLMLLAVLAILFCIFKFLFLVYKMSDWAEVEYYDHILNWFRLPANIETFLHRPWTLITYMFVHDDVLGLIGNVLWLWAFGFILQDLTGNGKLVPLYIYGGLVGAAIFIITANLMPALAPVKNQFFFEGASASLMAIAIGTTVMAPGYRIFPMINGGIPLWVLTIIYVALAFSRGINIQSTPILLAHLGAAGIGYLFIQQLKRGSDWSEWMNEAWDWATNLFNPDRRNWKKTAKDDLYYNSKGTQPFKKIPNITQKRIDEILDKINQQGYRYLTEEEKEILKRAAEDEDL